MRTRYSFSIPQMLGIWAVTQWQAAGCPPAFRLVELGPGRGTLMADALRGTAPLSDFARALSVHFVEVQCHHAPTCCLCGFCTGTHISCARAA